MIRVQWWNNAVFDNIGYKVYWSDKYDEFHPSNLVTTLPGLTAAEFTYDHNSDAWYTTYSKTNLEDYRKYDVYMTPPSWWEIRKFEWDYPESIEFQY